MSLQLKVPAVPRLLLRQQDKSLFVPTIWKPFVFGLLVFAFHIVEAVIKRLIHGFTWPKRRTSYAVISSPRGTS